MQGRGPMPRYLQTLFAALGSPRHQEYSMKRVLDTSRRFRGCSYVLDALPSSHVISPRATARKFLMRNESRDADARLDLCTSTE
jgi:hypothetical protein